MLKLSHQNPVLERLAEEQRPKPPKEKKGPANKKKSTTTATTPTTTVFVKSKAALDKLAKSNPSGFSGRQLSGTTLAMFANKLVDAKSTIVKSRSVDQLSAPPDKKRIVSTKYLVTDAKHSAKGGGAGGGQGFFPKCRRPASAEPKRAQAKPSAEIIVYEISDSDDD